MHFWICLDLRKAGKLVRSETNSQILRYLHFCEPTARFCRVPKWVIFSQCKSITLRAEGLYESFLDISWPKDHRKIAPEWNEFTDSEIYSLLWWTFAIFSLPKLSPNSHCSGITLRAEGLYESFVIFGHFWCHEKIFPCWGFFLKQ